MGKIFVKNECGSAGSFVGCSRDACRLKHCRVSQMVNKVIYESNSWMQISAPGAASAVLFVHYCKRIPYNESHEAADSTER